MRAIKNNINCVGTSVTLALAGVFANGKKYEFKSWTPNTRNPWNSFFSGTGNSYNQFIRYLENSNSLNDIVYVFNVNKADLNTVKNAFKDLFVNNAEEMFKPVNQGGLGQVKINQLFKLDGMNDIVDANQFILLMNNTLAFRNNALKFIKAE